MNRLNYDYGYVTDRSKGYTKPQLFNSALPSTYNENYSFRSTRRFRSLLIGMCFIAISAYLVVFEFGLFDSLFIDLFLK